MDENDDGEADALGDMNNASAAPRDPNFWCLHKFIDNISVNRSGFISAQLHRGIGGSSTFFNYVVWESGEHFKQAFSRPEFRSSMAELLPDTIMSPHLFKKVAIPGICVD
jgi:quinol monooxygenase YgiN